MKEIFSEPWRRTGALIAQWGGWLGALTIYVWSILARAGGPAPHWTSLTFIGLLAIAIAGTTARARMRLAGMIVDAFIVGMDSSKKEGDK